MNAKLSATIVGIFFLSACELEAPDALPVEKYVGCYRASEAPDLNLLPDAIHINAGPTAPFRVEMRKVGLVLAVPLVSEVNRGFLTFSKANDYYFYRILPHGADHSIQVVTSSGTTVTYNRTSLEPCPV